MREILFRGKRKDNGRWVEGDLTHSVYKIGDTCVGTYGSEIGMHQVHSDTVGQFTGLTDKNGTRIFEGDIIRTSKYGKVLNDYNSNDEDTFCVVYRPALFRLEREKPPRGFNLVDDGFSKMEVIGNIHDNPELLKGGANG